MDFANGTEYRQQIKTFRLKYIFLAGKIFRMARSVVLKLSKNYPYQEIYAKSLPWKNSRFLISNRYFHLNWTWNNHFQCPNLWNGSIKILYNKGNHAKLKCVQPQPSPLQSENGGKNHQTWNIDITFWKIIQMQLQRCRLALMPIIVKN